MEISNEEREKLLKKLELLIIENDKRKIALKRLMELHNEINEKLGRQIDELFEELNKIHQEGNEIVTQLKKLKNN